MRFSHRLSLTQAIGVEYDAQCGMLCYGPYPTGEEIQTRFLELRGLL